MPLPACGEGSLHGPGTAAGGWAAVEFFGFRGTNAHVVVEEGARPSRCRGFVGEADGEQGDGGQVSDPALREIPRRLMTSPAKRVVLRSAT